MEDFRRLGSLSLRQSAILVQNLDGWDFRSGTFLAVFKCFFSGLQEAVGVMWGIFLVSRLIYSPVGMKSIHEMKNKFLISENAVSCLETVLWHFPMLVFKERVYIPSRLRT